MKKKICNICFQEYSQNKISSCINCIESGNTCHKCEIKWVLQGNHPQRCIVCKMDTKQNVSPKSLKIIKNNVDTENNGQTNLHLECHYDETLCTLRIIIIILVTLLLTLITYFIYWCLNNYK